MIFKGTLESGTTNPQPGIEWFKANHPNGTAMLVFAGGGYGGLSRHEGTGYAEYFAAKGIHCFNVTYRLGTDGHRHPAMLEDSLAAMAEVRSRAGEFGINPNRIGVIGSSAGGHLAAHTVVAHSHYEASVSLRPDFGVLCYPVITGSHLSSHAGSFINLLGEDPDPALLDEVSCEKHVTSETPPCFLWHTAGDTAVPPANSMIFAEQLQKHNIPHELHIYAKGGHGIGMGGEFEWENDCIRWINGLWT